MIQCIKLKQYRITSDSLFPINDCGIGSQMVRFISFTSGKYLQQQQYYKVMLQTLRRNKLNQQNYTEIQEEQLLSSKMHRLRMFPQDFRFFQRAQLMEDNVEIKINKEEQKLPLILQNLKLKADQTIQKNKSISKSLKKSKKSKKVIEQLKPLKYQNYKLFEIKKSNEGKRTRTHYTQLLDMKIQEYSGYAVLVLPNMKKYEGEWVNGTLIGNVKISYLNGDRYQGKVYNYKKHGLGSQFKENGYKYVGEFCYGEYHGQGKLYDKDGDIVYDGQWKRGEKYMY